VGYLVESPISPSSIPYVAKAFYDMSEHHLKAMGIQVAATEYDRQSVSDHTNNLASRIRRNLTRYLATKEH